jgi:hypothetical protein
VHGHFDCVVVLFPGNRNVVTHRDDGLNLQNDFMETAHLTRK